MPRRRPKFPPAIYFHRPTGQTRIRVNGRDHWLGAADSPEAVTEYRRLCAVLQANGGMIPSSADTLTVGGLVARFDVHAEQHYRKGGVPTSELRSFRLSFRPLLHLYRDTPASELGPLALQAVRALMVEGWQCEQWTHGPLARRTVNQQIGRIRRLYKWGVSQQLVPVEVYQSLTAVADLQAGRSSAADYEPVEDVADTVVEQTLPHMAPIAAAMVNLQRASGMRPGEVVLIRPRDVDRDVFLVEGVSVWVYRPASHKAMHHGHWRAVALGPRAQAILLPWLDRDAEAFCFSPSQARELRYQTMRAGRKTPVQPSQEDRSKAAPARAPGERYTTHSYSQAIRAACRKAGIERWHAHQLRHSAGTLAQASAAEIADLHKPLNVTRAVLGQKSRAVAAIYAHADLQIAARFAAKYG